MDRRTSDAWTEIMVHSALDCSQAACAANWTKLSLVDFMKKFSSFVKGMTPTEELKELKSYLADVYRNSRLAAKTTLNVRDKVRSFLINLMDRTAIRPIDEDIN